MPELPEVETIKNDLKKRIPNIRISDINILLARTVKNNVRDFKKILADNKFADIDRVGKLLIFKLKRGGQFLLVHLKMTGQLIYRRRGFMVAGGHSDKSAILELPNKHTRVWLSFADGGRLFFNDLRTFGYMKLVDAAELKKVFGKFGLEPLDDKFNFAHLKNLFKARKTNIKALLLDQRLIAGLGNIYVDEALFRAGVLPWRRVNTLTDAEIRKIALSARAVLLSGIKYRGTTFNNYVDADGHKGNFVKQLKVYGRVGKKCVRCGGVIRKKKVAGRGTSYCEECQK